MSKQEVRKRPCYIGAKELEKRTFYRNFWPTVKWWSNSHAIIYFTKNEHCTELWQPNSRSTMIYLDLDSRSLNGPVCNTISKANTSKVK